MKYWTAMPSNVKYLPTANVMITLTKSPMLSRAMGTVRPALWAHGTVEPSPWHCSPELNSQKQF